MGQIQSKTILFITGAFVNHACWNDWKTFFEAKGYTTIVSPWPGKDGDPETLRARHPDSALAKITLQDVLSHYINIIKTLPEKPIIIGHSFGGLMAQVLMTKGMAAAVVAIHAAPPKGVIPYELNFLRSSIKAFGYFTSIEKTYLMSFKTWQFAFTNGMDFEAQKNGYKAIATPESKRALRGGLSDAAKVDFKKDHNPLLFLAGTQDHCIPAHLCKRVFNRYKSKTSVREFILKDRNHFVLGLPTWQEDATAILKWLQQH